MIRRDESDNISTQGDPHGVWYRFAGREIATTANKADPNQLSYSASIADRTRALPGSTPACAGAGRFTADGGPDQDLMFEAVNSYRQGAAGGRYVVQSGDTLQSIAQSLWGDSALWYKLAEGVGRRTAGGCPSMTGAVGPRRDAGRGPGAEPARRSHPLHQQRRDLQALRPGRGDRQHQPRQPQAEEEQQMRHVRAGAAGGDRGRGDDDDWVLAPELGSKLVNRHRIGW